MKDQKKIVRKYEELFGTIKPFVEILGECHEKIKSLKDLKFSMTDFKEDDKAEELIRSIEEYRLYAKLDDFILLADKEEQALQVISDNQDDFMSGITYHEVIEAKAFFDEHFANMEHFYIERNHEVLRPNSEIYKVLTVNDIFENNSNAKHKLFEVETAKVYYFTVTHEGYEFVFKTPIRIENINIQEKNKETHMFFGFLYLIKSFVQTNIEDFDLSKKYTTIYREYGYTYNDYNNSAYDHSVGKFTVYRRNVLPFIIENESIEHKPHLHVLDKNFGWVNMYGDEKKQLQDFLKYFETMKINYEAIKQYLENNWYLKADIGKYYNYNYNFVGTKEEVEEFKNNIIAEKYFDIKFNIVLYKRYGLFKYGYLEEGKRLPKLPSYKTYIREYLETIKTDKKDFGTERDKRINLDTSFIRLGVNAIFRNPHLQNLDTFKRPAPVSFLDANRNSFENGVFDEEKSDKNIELQIDLVSFIKAYNKSKNEIVLKAEYEWYFPYGQLSHYVFDNCALFCKIYNSSGYRPEEMNTLLNNFYFEGNTIKTKYEDPNFPKRNLNYSLNNKNPYYYEIPMRLNVYITEKDFEKIKKGTHPYFKSEYVETEESNFQELLSNTPRLLPKKEVEEKDDREVVYTLHSSDQIGVPMVKGLKGQIVGHDKAGVTIVDELGREHKIAYSQIRTCGWKNVSTLDYNSFYEGLSIKDKAFLENNRKLLETKQQLALEEGKN